MNFGEKHAVLHTKKKNNVVLICGECKHVCDPCTELGWISTAGTGGGDHLYNVELNLKIVKGKTLVYMIGQENDG